MKQKITFAAIGVFLFLFLTIMSAIPLAASPSLQLTPFPTPTPQIDGRIIYIVQSGDTLWRISSVTGVSVDELRLLNNLETGDVINVGTGLLIAVIAPTPAPAEQGGDDGGDDTETLVDPEGIDGAISDSGVICVLLYEDINGDQIRQGNEYAIGGGEVSVTERLGAFSGTKTTQEVIDDDFAAPVCFEDIPPGEYNITIAVPQEYNPTTALTTNLEIVPGQVSTLNFGAQLSTIAQITEPGITEGGRSPLLGVIGFFMIVAAIGMGGFSYYLAKK